MHDEQLKHPEHITATATSDIKRSVSAPAQRTAPLHQHRTSRGNGLTCDGAKMSGNEHKELQAARFRPHISEPPHRD